MSKRLGSVVLMSVAAVVGGCGGGDGPSTPSPVPPSDLQPSDMARTASFWVAQRADGRLTLARMCKADAARKAGDRAEASTADTADDPSASMSAGYEARDAINAIDTNDLVKKISSSLKSNGSQTIGAACLTLVANATSPTVVTLTGVHREGALGADAYTAEPTRLVDLRGSIEPAGDGAEFDLERRTAAQWDYVDSVVAEEDGSFRVKLNAYRTSSNVYRLRARGSGASTPRTVEIYFDGPRTKRTARKPAPKRPSRTAAKVVLTFSGNGAKRLGTIRVPQDSLLTWTNTGDLFSVSDDDGGIVVSSTGRKGDSAVDAGTYRGVVINAIGDWTIKIVAAE